jgi:anti-sigma28 factor (negative regulator of flagellin synthesis)
MHQHGPSCLKGPVLRDRFQQPGTLSPSDSPAPIRWDLVERIRAEIAEGTYETPEKWQAAVDRLLDQLEK